MWWGWKVMLIACAVGMALLFAALVIAIADNGFPAPIQDMNRTSPEELESHYGTTPSYCFCIWASNPLRPPCHPP